MSSSSSLSSVGCRPFSLDEIKDATNNFHENNVIGSGGEGKVYRGHIPTGRDEEKILVAVKRFNRKLNSIEFDREIRIFSKIRHPNLVSLLGYCNELNQNILVYEYMENGSLSEYVKQKSSICLSWTQRLNICLGAARGMQHLHTPTDELPKGIIHRDMKPANILLDKDWVAKVSDFGLAKLSDPGQTNSTLPTDLKGTNGYYAPEYLKTNKMTRKIDVYSFGMVLFEVLCRKRRWYREDDKSTYDEDIGDWALENVDTEISGKISHDSLMKFVDIIRKCLREEVSDRPTMDEVVLDLEGALKWHERGNTRSKSSEALIVSGLRSARLVFHVRDEPPIPHITQHETRSVMLRLQDRCIDQYKCHPFWQQKYCPSHDHDGTPKCDICERMQPIDKRYMYRGYGRKQCSECDESAMHTDECQTLYLEIQEFFNGLNMKIEQHFPLLLVWKDELDEAMRLERKLGYYNIWNAGGLFLSVDQNVSIFSRSKAWVVNLFTDPNRPIRRYKAKTILILNDFPRLLTGLILARLMMQAWLRIKGYPYLPLDVEQGICNVLAHMWLVSEIQAGFGSGSSDASTPSSSSAAPTLSKKGNLSQFEKQLGEFLKWCIESSDRNGFKEGNKAVFKYGLKTTLDHIRHKQKFPNE